VKVLVTGGVRSGKSFHAESLLLAEAEVTYIAPGPVADPASDPEWAVRVARHQQRRPTHWRTCETHDLAAALQDCAGAVIVDCLGTWLTAQLDELDGWDKTRDDWEPVLRERIDAVAAAVAGHRGSLVAVTNEVGMGVVPEHFSGRIFRDLLGIVNQRVAAECDQVMLVIAGRVLTL